jgi:hypothetical protein
MTTSQETPFLSEILNGEPIPKGKLEFFRERFRDHLYELVVDEFLKQETAGLLTKADIARRIHRKPEQITRWLGAPGNWEIETVSDLLLAISKAEPKVTLSMLGQVADSAETQVSRTYQLPQKITSAETPRQPFKLTRVEGPLRHFIGSVTMALLPSPDVYGFTIFCDDIRQESDGKLIFIGVYSGVMIIHVPFPAKLPTFAMSATVFQRKKVFIPRVGLRVFLPGDAEDAASIQVEAGETVDGTIVAATSAEVDTLHPDAQVPDEERYVSMHANMRFAQFEIKRPGIIKVRGVVGDSIVRLGGMRISPPPQSNPP